MHAFFFNAECRMRNEKWHCKVFFVFWVVIERKMWYNTFATTFLTMPYIGKTIFK